MKKIIKLGICVVVFILLFLLTVFYIIQNMTKEKLIEIGTEISPDGSYSVIFQEKEETAGNAINVNAVIAVYEKDRIITQWEENISDDREFNMETYSVEWFPMGVIITLHGGKQTDSVHEVYFDGRTESGYTREEAAKILAGRYDIQNIDSIRLRNDIFTVKGDGIEFMAINSLPLPDNYPAEKFKSLTDGFFPEIFQRILEWEEIYGENETDTVYVPVIYFSGGITGITKYCSDICDWLSVCTSEMPYEKYEKVYVGFIPYISGEENSVFSVREYISDRFDRDALYRDLYDYLNDILSDNTDMPSYSNENNIVDRDEISESAVESWASIPTDAYYRFEDGTEYRMVPADRALGSNYYVLIAVKGDDTLVELVNIDPYNGFGGNALWLDFIDDTDIGFSCLTFNGGDSAVLFRTEDKGESFQAINYPSAKVELADGTIYQPFVIPQRVWMEDDRLYMIAAQGANGDYYGRDGSGLVSGLYVSEDKGLTFTYEDEILSK